MDEHELEIKKWREGAEAMHAGISRFKVAMLLRAMNHEIQRRNAVNVEVREEMGLRDEELREAMKLLEQYLPGHKVYENEK